MLERRRFLLGAAALSLSGCKVFDGAASRDAVSRAVFESVTPLTYRAQRLLSGDQSLAPEYGQADIRQGQRPNGSVDPDGADYVALKTNAFTDYRLSITGMVHKPLTLSLADLKAMPPRTQITRHDCVEGWSCIGKWTGVPMADVINAARPSLTARYAVFHCFDTLERSLSGEVKYYESIDLVDVYHPQTILAYGLNDRPLPVANGAPLRVRIERQLGYKMAKYIHTIELVDNLSGFGLGHGSYWADRGYQWYAGI